MIANNNIFLLGFMGSGKSTLGKKLAKQLSLPFYDLDDEIEAQEKKTIAQIFEEKGEDRFRKIETQLLKKLTQQSTSFVLALGGGTPCFYDNMKIINQSGTSIYIKYNAGILCSRLINAKAQRPLIAGKTKEELLSFIEETLIVREEYYNQSQFIVEGNNIKVEDLLVL